MARAIEGVDSVVPRAFRVAWVRVGLMKLGTRAACAVSMIALVGTASASEVCWTPKELAAARVRDVQTIMMVGALQCSAQGYNTAFGYDRFVTRHRAELVEANDVLKRHFMRQAASSTGQRDYDAFATAMANGHSAESGDMRNYCDRVDSLVRSAVSVRGDELAAFTADVSERPLGVGEDCGRAEIATNDALPPPRDDEVLRPQQVAVAVTVTTPPAAPEPIAAVVEQVAAVEPAPQVAPVADDAAVRQATAALQQATAALQAAIAAQQARPAVSQASVQSSPPASAGPASRSRSSC